MKKNLADDVKKNLADAFKPAPRAAAGAEEGAKVTHGTRVHCERAAGRVAGVRTGPVVQHRAGPQVRGQVVAAKRTRIKQKVGGEAALTRMKSPQEVASSRA